MFGILSPTPLVEYTLVGCGGSSFAQAVGAINLRAIILGGLSNESDGSKAARQDMNCVASVAMTFAFLLAALRPDFEYMTGSFAGFWVLFMAIMAAGYILILMKEFQTIRKPMSEHLFKGDIEDKVEAVNAFVFILYGVIMFISMGLHLPLTQPIISVLMTFFGLFKLDPSDTTITYSFDALAGGCWALGMAAINLITFSGSNENADYGQTRRQADIVFWVSSVIGFTNYPENGMFFTFWVTISLGLAIYLVMKNEKTGSYQSLA